MGLVAQILGQEIEKHLPLLTRSATYLLVYAVWPANVPPRNITIFKHRLKPNFLILAVAQRLFAVPFKMKYFSHEKFPTLESHTF